MTRPIRQTTAAWVVAVLVAGLLVGLGGSPVSAAPVLYEAEQATIINGTVDSNHPGFTGTGFVNTANAIDSGIEFAVNLASGGTATLTFRYANGTTSNRPAAITIDGAAHSTQPFPPTGSWSTWANQTFTAPLASGAHTVRALATTSGGLANIDSLTVDVQTTQPLYEAESAAIINGVVESNHAGFTGTGFVNTANAVGSGVQFTVTTAAAGTRRLVVRYANGTTGNRPASVMVNGNSPHPNAPFPATGAWTTWRTQVIDATLRAGANTVRLLSTTSGGMANIDSLADQGTPTGAISDPIPEEPVQSGLGLTLTQFSQFPQTTPVPAPTDPRLMRWARINFLGQIPGSTRLFSPDLNGQLYTVPPAGGTPSVYLDVRAAVGSNFFSGRGLGSGFGFVAFHPDFATNGRFYTTHSEGFDALTSITPDWTQPNAVVHSVLSEWTATNPAAATFSGTRRTLMRIGFAAYIHAIQQIDFNPTAAPGSADYGLLYVAVGDGGIGYQTTVPQQRNIPHGKILRIDPRGTNSTNGNYGIPPSNPFVGQAGTLGEIYALGMRDPHRFSWDTAGTNRMLLGHIGEHDIEGVYDVRAGDNLGWSDREGSWVFDRQERCNLYPLPANDSQFGYNYPVAAYDHNAATIPCGSDAGKAIVGGFVYRGTALPALRGKYVFGDLVDGRVFYTNEAEMVRGQFRAPVYRLRIFTPAGTETTMAALAGDSRVDMRFGVDRAGELYVLSKANGRIWKVTGVRGSAP
ncbi:MAG TPA: carbohydrate-binding protein [Pilimelia sp.]|nr:carbohydrate-binding protein [Pilimelia sp.]